MSVTADHQQLVRDIIDENQYLSLATTDGERAWVAPVAYSTDDELNFYFVSLKSSRHIRHIAHNPQVAFAIFDSRQPLFTGRGIQVQGTVQTFSETENPHVIFGDRQDLSADLTSADADYAAFKIQPAKFYAVKGYVEEEWRDERVEVPMAL